MNDEAFWKKDAELGKTLDGIESQLKRGRPTKELEGATGHIHIRTTLNRKTAYVKAAKGKPLAEWITEQCDKAANYEPPQ